MPKGEPGLFVSYCAKDFLDGTQMLDPWEELAYRRICDMIYVTNDRLIDDDRKLAWATKTGRRWLAIKASLTSGDKPKLQIVDGRITNARCQSALGTAAKKIAQQRGAAAASVSTGKSLKNLKQNRAGVREPGREVDRTEPRTNHLTTNYQEEEDKLPNGSLSGNGKSRSTDPAIEMTKIWNEECAFRPARKPKPARQANCRRRWVEDFDSDAEQWRAYCRQVAAAPHLRGENDRDWKADLDWVLKPSNMVHIQEGRYERRSSVSATYAGPDQPAPSPEELFGDDYAGKVGMAH